MSSSIATAEIRLTQNKDALAKLRRLGIARDGRGLIVDQHGERYDAMFDSNSIPFWIGQVRTIPQSWAESLVDTYKMPLDEGCKHCKPTGKYDPHVAGTGATIAGICHQCRGTGWVDSNRTAPLFKILSSTDPLALNPQNYQAPPELPTASVESLTK